MMRIGDAARLSGVSARLIRYYESEGLLSPAGRDTNGYRIFDERNLHELRFIKRARSLGFPIKQIDELLGLWRDKRRPSRKVRALAERHKETVVSRMEAHRSIVDVLSRLIEACKGDDRPDCPILDELSGGRTRQP
jgi:MerR family transcriptional regulator, copper efflux regulator